ncbi:hypothetical protein [Nostoc sp. TCL26-01]|uniref:hypothetical protein n=1 Tax=Nostoc sp. TCL26-01 TaxID=2576904 RepID=UPI0015B965D8|nr:hypothetical protein [Nostoc sp. TCL26-01]QLE54437.1 hypothetical protein FD725_02265 [Nostoc sp. TCL26-01]
MEQNQQHPRQEAEQEFQASLEQLEDILQENLTEDKDQPNIPIDDSSGVKAVDDETDIDLAALEDAVADIEHYLEERTKTK